MKTKDLIKLLQEEDPSGEEQVCIGNADIVGLYSEVAYWDGALQIFERDDKGKIIGGKYKTSGNKIVIVYQSFSDTLIDFDIPIDYSELSEYKRDKMIENHNNLKKFVYNIGLKLELKNFTQWAKNKAAEITVELEDIENIAFSFFEKNNINQDIPLPVGKDSYVNRRYQQWDSLYELSIETGFLQIKCK